MCENFLANYVGYVTPTQFCNTIEQAPYHDPVFINNRPLDIVNHYCEHR